MHTPDHMDICKDTDNGTYRLTCRISWNHDVCCLDDVEPTDLDYRENGKWHTWMPVKFKESDLDYLFGDDWAHQVIDAAADHLAGMAEDYRDMLADEQMDRMREQRL